MRQFSTTLAALLVAGSSAGQSATLVAQAPASVAAGDNFTVEVFAALTGVPSGAALAAFGVDAVATGDTAGVTGIGSVAFDSLSTGTFEGQVDGADLLGVVGGQIADVFGLNPVVDTSTTIKLYEFTVQTSASATGEVTYTPAEAMGLLVFNDGTDGANQAVPVTGSTAATTSIGVECLPDTNNDGIVSPADFNGWILAYNAQSPECDQNGDGLCTPADFNAWILNFNAGC